MEGEIDEREMEHSIALFLYCSCPSFSNTHANHRWTAHFLSEAMGIVRSKVYGGANPYGTGRGIIDVGKGAYR